MLSEVQAAAVTGTDRRNNVLMELIKNLYRPQYERLPQMAVGLIEFRSIHVKLGPPPSN